MARTVGDFENVSKGTSHGAKTQDVITNISRRYGYEVFERGLNKRLERITARGNLQVTKQQSRAQRYVAQVNEANQAASQAAQGLGTATEAFNAAKTAKVQAVGAYRQQQAIHEALGIPITDPTLQGRAQMARSDARRTRIDYRQARARTESLLEATTAPAVQAAAYASSVQKIADYQAAQREAVRLRMSKRLTSFV